MRGPICAGALASALIALFCSPALAQTSAGITGTVVDASSQARIASARVVLQGQGPEKVATTDASGTFAFTSLAAGSYVLNITARGYVGGNGNPVVVTAGESVAVTVALSPASTTSLKQIAQISIAGRQAINTTSAPTVTITKQDFVKNGDLLVQQGLERVPGVTIEHFDGGLGSVATLTIRGAGGFVAGSNTGYEVLVLQDGEPIRNGQYGDFDLTTLTPSIYKNVEVLKGVGGTSLFGANTIGGTLNLETIDPQATAGGEFMGTLGSFSTSQYDLALTDTMGRFGYVLDVHRLTTQGDFPANFRADYTHSRCATTCIWTPTHSFNLQSALAKFKYAISNTTYLTLTGSGEADSRDQLGLLTNPTTVGGNATDANGIPYFYGYPGDTVFNTQPKVAAELHSQIAGGDLVLRTYGGTLNRIVDGNNEPAGVCCFYQRSVDRLYGDELEWTKSNDRNEFTFGYGGNGDSYIYGSTGSNGTTLGPNDISYTGGKQTEHTTVVRDTYQLTQHLQLQGTLFYSAYDTLQVKRIDPRIGVVYRPDSSTAVRFSYSTGFAPPRLSDLYNPLDLNVNDSGSDPRCPSSNQYCVASTGNGSLKSESATGYDLGVDRAFESGRGIFSLDLYRTNVSGHIFTANLPAPAGLLFSDNMTPVLYISTPINLAGSTYTGFESSIRLPIVGDLALTGAYSTTAAYPVGVDYNTQYNAGDLVNNQQFDGVPLHQANYGIDYRRSNGFELFFNNVYYGNNNSYYVPPFWAANAGAVLPLQSGNQLNIAWTNLGNKNATIYQLYGQGVPYAGLAGPYSTSVHPFQPTTFLVTFSHRFGSLAQPSIHF